MTILKGYPGSSGRVTGSARVITKLEEAKTFQPGEILVTIATSPAWTPLIHISAGVITDKGGSLCHAAIVSREYGIPAVVGTRTASAVIKTGMEITMDGTTGEVYIE